MSESTSLLTFPCEFTIKIFGKATLEFESAVVSILRNHVADLSEPAIKTNLSKNNKFLSMSVTFIAESKDHLDAIYVDLTTSEHIIMVL
jgi:putative lipoic acid-binding regulatory protein